MRLPERRGHVLLHIAPERGIASHLARNFAITYVTADRNPDAADICTDLTKLAFRDATFDVILCSHVLEHVPDDRSAMRELFRVLKPGGWAMLQVPVDMSRDSTFEDPAIVDPVERERLFDQADHVRVYGRDYVDRLAHAGFEVQQDRYAWEVGEAAIRRYALLPEIIHVCRRVGA